MPCTMCGTGTHSATDAAVRAALEYLGVEPRNFRLLPSAMPAAAHECPGLPQPYVSSRPCQSYSDTCALHALLGQLWSRRALFELIVEHERRESARLASAWRFDSVLFIRPDLAALLPLLPWCFYDLSVSRDVADWVWWMPREQAEVAMVETYDDWYKSGPHTCALPHRAPSPRCTADLMHHVWHRCCCARSTRAATE